MRSYLLILFLLFCQIALAQHLNPLPAVQEKMKALKWLTGQWQGNGYIIRESGKKQEFIQTEKVTFKLNNSVLQIEGIGVQGSDTAFQAMAIISYNTFPAKYSFRAYTNGYQSDAEAEVSDKMLIWRLQSPGNLIRYTINLNEKGQWNEIGERSADEGKNWQTFFEMTLSRPPSKVSLSKSK